MCLARAAMEINHILSVSLIPAAMQAWGVVRQVTSLCPSRTPEGLCIPFTSIQRVDFCFFIFFNVYLLTLRESASVSGVGVGTERQRQRHQRIHPISTVSTEPCAALDLTD